MSSKNSSIAANYAATLQPVSKQMFNDVMDLSNPATMVAG
jgi:hypothetical protein